jgi:hypothetical protein
MDACPTNQELMVQHEQFQFQPIEELLKGVQENKVTVPKAPANRGKVTVVSIIPNSDSQYILSLTHYEIYRQHVLRK